MYRNDIDASEVSLSPHPKLLARSRDGNRILKHHGDAEHPNIESSCLLDETGNTHMYG